MVFWLSSWGPNWPKIDQNHPSETLPKSTQNSPRTTPNHPQKTRHHTPRQPRHDTHLHSGHGVGKWAPRGAGGGRTGAHLPIWGGLLVGLVGAAPALASVWILVGVW